MSQCLSWPSLKHNSSTYAFISRYTPRGSGVAVDAAQPSLHPVFFLLDPSDSYLYVPHSSATTTRHHRPVCTVIEAIQPRNGIRFPFLRPYTRPPQQLLGLPLALRHTIRCFKSFLARTRGCCRVPCAPRCSQSRSRRWKCARRRSSSQVPTERFVLKGYLQSARI